VRCSLNRGCRVQAVRALGLVVRVRVHAVWRGVGVWKWRLGW